MESSHWGRSHPYLGCSLFRDSASIDAQGTRTPPSQPPAQEAMEPGVEAPTVASRVAPVVKSLPGNAGDIRDVGLIPGSGRSPGGGTDNPLQYSCLENPTDRGAWRATVHGVTKSQKQPVYSHASCPQPTTDWEEEKADRGWQCRPETLGDIPG